jgi:hypothetical protein
MMVINLTNINTMNNHLSYYLSPLNTKEITTYYIGNAGPVLEQTHCTSKPLNNSNMMTYFL